MIDAGGQGLGPARTRGPDLRPHILDQRHARQHLAQGLGYTDGEAPAVDQDHGVGPLSLGQSHCVGHPALDQTIGLQALDPAQNRQFGDIERAGHAFSRHLGTADAHEGDISAQTRLQGLRQTGAQGVARGLGGDQHDLQRTAHRSTPQTNRPRRSAASTRASWSMIISRPAKPPIPASPAAAASSTVVGPMTGMSTRRS
ncbi:hypothetical protein D3C72_1398360 [compost metagenome]